MRPTRVLLFVGLANVALFLVGVAFDLHTLRLVTKPWPAIALAVAVWIFRSRPTATPIAIGLVLSAVGDVFLEISDATFLYGVGAFLLAHVAYVVAFVRAEKRLRLLWAIPFAAWGVGLVGWLRDGLDASGMLIPVAVYSTVICTMMWRAAARLGSGRAGTLAFGGALLFAASDSLIALDRFGDLSFDGIRYAIILLYWIGQTGIAASTWTASTWTASTRTASNRHDARR